MKDHNIIKEMIINKGGIAKTSDFIILGMNNREIIELLNCRFITRVKHGYYTLTDEEEPNESEIINRLYPDGVLCMDTALFYYDYSDRTPLHWSITFDRTVSRSRFKLDYPFIKPYFVEKKYISIGVTRAEINGVYLNIFDRERVICDCLRHKNKIEKETFNKAVQAYINDSKKNVKNLTEYAKSLRVYNKAKELIGVWL